MSHVEGQQSSVFSDLPGHANEPRVSETQVICLGNEKGGSGKSTTAMHLVVAILRLGKRVGGIDLDARQKSFARYIENRTDWNRRQGLSLAIPEVRVVAPSQLENKSEAHAEEKAQFDGALRQLTKTCDFIVIDSPGADTHLSRLGHAAADTVITPLNDSFVDLDLIAHVDPETFEIKGPSLYAEMIWESRKQRALSDRHTIDWVLMRNRLSSLDAKNKRRMSDVLEKLAPRTGFRIAPGFGERVIYRELFPNGLTLLDLGNPDSDVQLTMSHVAARQELRDLLVTLNLPGLEKAAVTF